MCSEGVVGVEGVGVGGCAARFMSEPATQAVATRRIPLGRTSRAYDLAAATHTGSLSSLISTRRRGTRGPLGPYLVAYHPTKYEEEAPHTPECEEEQCGLDVLVSVEE